MTILLASLRRPALATGWVCKSCRRPLSSTARRSVSVKKDTLAAQYKLPDFPARTRFAPSPTGYLHLGSLRTALFSYLLAKSTGGQFLLRIEDTDQTRTVPDAEERLIDDLLWAGLHWDEGPKVWGPYGPYKQSERLETYRQYSDQLLNSGKAYRCFCPKEQVQLGDGLHGHVQGKPHDCDKLKKEVSDDRASKGESYVVRLNINGQNPDYVDLVYGRVKGHKGRDPRLTGRAIDPVLMKSDRWPTYHLANVVDDHLMKITHVIRGTEWMPSTPTHLQLYSAFGWQPPVFGHVGLLTDMTGAKLSKRNFDLDIRSYQKNGVLPEALNNFIALLGWSHLKQKDTMSLAELTANFTTKFTKGNTKVSFDKLWFLQRQHARKLIEAAESPEQAKQLIQPVIDQLISQKSAFISAVPDQQVQQERSLALLKADAPNYKNAEDFVQRHRLFFDRPCTESLKNVSPSPFRNGHLEPPFEAIDGDQHIRASNLSLILIENFKQVADGDWTKDKLLQRFKQVVDSIALESGEGIAVTEETQQLLVKRWNWAGYRYLRWALFADQAGPDTISMMAALGKDEALKRLETAASALQEMHVRQ